MSINLDLLKLRGDSNPEKLQFPNFWVSIKSVDSNVSQLERKINVVCI